MTGKWSILGLRELQSLGWINVHSKFWCKHRHLINGKAWFTPKTETVHVWDGCSEYLGRPLDEWYLGIPYWLGARRFAPKWSDLLHSERSWVNPMSDLLPRLTYLLPLSRFVKMGLQKNLIDILVRISKLEKVKIQPAKLEPDLDSLGSDRSLEVHSICCSSQIWMPYVSICAMAVPHVLVGSNHSVPLEKNMVSYQA